MPATEDVAAELERTYDAIAPEYAQRWERMPAELARRARRFAAAVGRGGHVLDLGCGSGRDLAWFEAHGMRVTGADRSAGMLAEARRRTGARLIKCDMRRLPIPSASLDGVWACASLMHLPKRDLPAVLAEVHRVLRPGGRTFFTLTAGQGEGWEHDVYAQPRFYARYDLAEVRRAVRDSGLRLVSVRCSGSGSRRWINVVAVRPAATLS